MAAEAFPPETNFVEQNYVSSCPAELTFSNTETNSVRQYTITYADGRKVNGTVYHVDNLRYLTLEKKATYTVQAKSNGKVKGKLFHGESTDRKDLRYDIEKAEDGYHVSTKNTTKDSSNYNITGSYSNKSRTVWSVSIDGSSDKIAWMHKLGQSYGVTIEPMQHCDFIAALFVFLDAKEGKKDYTVELL